MWEYLSLYSERDDGAEAFNVKHYPERGNKIAEDTLINQLGDEGWELVAVVPAYGGGGTKINHQLYFKRPKGEQRTQRLDRYSFDR
jgi:hypothetical protein